MDQLFVGLRYVALFTGLEVPSTSVVNEALATIAAAGPHTRVGVAPRPGRRIWRYDPDVTVPVHQLPEAVVNDGDAAVLQHIRRRPGCHSPLEVHVSQRHIAFDVDHRLGDGRLALELVSALFTHSRGHVAPWVANRDTSLALPRALVHTFAHPARLGMLWRHTTGLRSARTSGPHAAPGESVPWSPSSAVVVARVDADSEAAVNEWRRANAATSGSAAVWLYIARHALRSAGLRMTDGVMVAFDSRRYLPKRRTVNSNFIFGIDVPLAVDDRLPTVAARLREVTAAAVPLAAMGAVSARALLPFGRRPVVPSSCFGGAPADVMYTDMGDITAMLDDMPWRGDGDRSATGLIDPGGPNSVTILNSRLGAVRSVAMSFHDNVFDRRVIETAAGYLEHPIGLLDLEFPPSAS
ncbi:hypothetical protein [Mycobacterium sp. RTGN3]|uniref:hypothetical protein n=1 Tax=Mycobacterium sp. RTGN3 TaxID=3016524 RepID=UPI0029C8AC8C|nr:hypothetical protein [Mycobacterium sp. RTGN3]